jgi:hypothetical protein
LRQRRSLVRFIFIFYFVIRLPLCNKYSDYCDIYLYTLCYYICCLLGACMRCTWLCSLKSDVTPPPGAAPPPPPRPSVAPAPAPASRAAPSVPVPGFAPLPAARPLLTHALAPPSPPRRETPPRPCPGGCPRPRALGRAPARARAPANRVPRVCTARVPSARATRSRACDRSRTALNPVLIYFNLCSRRVASRASSRDDSFILYLLKCCVARFVARRFV